MRENHLLVHRVPYVTPATKVAYGTLVSTLTLNNDATIRPDTHVVWFMGEHPSHADGSEVPNLLHQHGPIAVTATITADFSFSNKPDAGFADYFEKMTSYINILQGHAQQIDPSVTAKTFIVRDDDDPDPVFLYADSASTRAGISVINNKLKLGKLAIVGVGGTGSYILDLVAKTPVREIHLYDGDRFLQHNAFRAPGAASKEDLAVVPHKVNYFAERYASMRRGIHPHPYDIDDSTIAELESMDFVFLSAEGGPTKQLVVERLQAVGVPFVDVGMGVFPNDGMLHGVLAVTTSDSSRQDHVARRIDFAVTDAADDYDLNIQIADLNALNATLAVIKWKKLFGYYADFEQEHYSTYTIDGNLILNEDQPK